MARSGRRKPGRAHVPEVRVEQFYRLSLGITALIAVSLVVKVLGVFMNEADDLGELVPFGFLLALSFGLVQAAQIAVNLDRRIRGLEAAAVHDGG